jgi:hypothetical protein
MGRRQGREPTVGCRAGVGDDSLPAPAYDAGVPHARLDTRKPHVFRRTKTETTPAPDDAAATNELPGSQKKGRPTPSRKEAEAARKARAKVPRTRKEIAAAQRASRDETSAQRRQAMRSGDDRYLPARDRGPVRRFIRDYVDSKFSFIELLLPLMVVVLILSWTGNRTVASYATTAMLVALALIVIDLVRLRFRLRRELRTRFPDAATNGTTYYAIARSMQMRFMRLPKAQVKIGQKLTDQYR